MKEIYKNPKKHIVCFDEPTFCGELAYGFSNKKEAIKALEEMTGEKVDVENIEKIKVLRIIKNGEEFYTWSDKCDHCGQEIKGGVWSYSNFG